MKKYILAFIVIIFFSNLTFSQEFSKPLSLKSLDEIEKSFSGKKNIFNFSSKNFPSKKDFVALTGKNSLGLNVGPAYVDESEWGVGIGAFADLKFSPKYSFVLGTNYWKVENSANFELSGLARMYLPAKTTLPYLDAGFGINFYNTDDDSKTKLGLSLGGGIQFNTGSEDFDVFFDGKYKLIISSPNNISAFIFSVGIKFLI